MASKPSPGAALFENLFGDPEASTRLVANGVHGLIANSRRLSQDATHLAESGAFASSTFLFNVMDEELGKIYILLDMLKLDFTQQESRLRRLCKAFYWHGPKAAYMQVNRRYQIAKMSEAGRAFANWATSWEEEIPQDGVPAMPSFWAANREWSLYVDLFPDSAEWFVPSNDWNASSFGTVGMYPTRASQDLKFFERSATDGQFAPEVLTDLHRAFSRHYFSAASSLDEVVAPAVEFAGSQGWDIPSRVHPADLAYERPLLGWPLYDFV